MFKMKNEMLFKYDNVIISMYFICIVENTKLMA